MQSFVIVVLAALTLCASASEEALCMGRCGPSGECGNPDICSCDYTTDRCVSAGELMENLPPTHASVVTEFSMKGGRGFRFDEESGRFKTFGADRQVQDRSVVTKIWMADGDAFFSVKDSEGNIGCIVHNDVNFYTNVPKVDIYSMNNTFCKVEMLNDNHVVIHVDAYADVNCQWTGVSCDGNAPDYVAHFTLQGSSPNAKFALASQDLCCTDAGCVPSTDKDCDGGLVAVSNTECHARLLEDGTDIQAGFYKDGGECTVIVTAEKGFAVMVIENANGVARMLPKFKKNLSPRVVRVSMFKYRVAL